jgi:DNA-binding NarL/FixJ family response regulator
MLDADIELSGIKGGERRKRGARRYFSLPGDLPSVREAEVCKLVLEGLAVKEVAFQLNIGYSTAENHRRARCTRNLAYTAEENSSDDSPSQIK